MPPFHIIGVAFVALSIALSAFGAHGLQGKISERALEIFHTATHYLTIHGLGLLLLTCCGRLDLFSATATSRSCWCLLIGTVIFSGSLYLIVATDIKKFGAITPIGGTLLIIGWLLLLLPSR